MSALGAGARLRPTPAGLVQLGHQPRWQIESDPAKTSEIEITFIQTTPGRTHVVLTHRNRHRDRHGDGWQSMREAVNSGLNLAHFAEMTEITEQTRPNSQVPGQTLATVTDETMCARLAAAKFYTAIVLHRTPAFVRPDVDPIVWEHGRRNMALLDAGLLSIVLPVTDDSGLAGLGSSYSPRRTP